MPKVDGRCDGKYCRAESSISLEMPELKEPLKLCYPCYSKWERETFPLTYEEGMP